ncbi:Anti-sigma-L factor RslA [Mycobacterium innocens]|uniref:Anti-sigma-L factor RslA n=1 Tax=Mycobacterium innocens TaxID=2341083 RepID=A0A498Q5Y6_9MYCO|nr:Anti-sigma-L factor RslA [Mycobacterium innocens]
MTCFPGRRCMPDVRKRPEKDCAEYVMWDAAYVLGSLSANDRREFERHLGGCTVCRKAVTELSGMPALLSVLDRDEVAAIVESSHPTGNFAEAVECGDVRAKSRLDGTAPRLRGA